MRIVIEENDVAREQHPGGTGKDTFLVDCVRSVLSRHGHEDWLIKTGAFWCYVQLPGGRSRIQGWKLHVSATPLSAPLVLARAAEVLVRHRCAFKFAQTCDRVQELVSHRYDRGGGGKFITAYPEGDDDQLLALAEELHRATEGLPGPGILSDLPYRPGSLVHYRFGVFNGVPMLGNDGSYEAMLVAPDGTLALDKRKAWFTPPAWAPHNPFTRQSPNSPATANVTAPKLPKPVLLNGRYVVREVIRHAFGGGVYRATDESTGETVIIKQARPHAGSSVTGRDIRDSRRHEAAMLERFESSGRTPRLLDLFEQQGDLFLVQEAVPGITLYRWVLENITLDDGDIWGPPSVAVERITGKLVDLVELVHAEGLVLRDFNPNNVMITADDDDLRLIDLEMLTRPGEYVVRAHTPGYGAPEQVNAPRLVAAPQQTADLYSLGATLFYLVSGIDPLLPPDEPRVRTDQERMQSWLAHLCAGNPAASRLAPIIVALLHEDPAQRPGLDAVRAFLTTRDQSHRAVDVSAPPRHLADVELKQLITDAIDHLLDTMDSGNPERLWPAVGFGATTEPFNVQHGAAGVLGVLTRAYQAQPDAALREAVATAAGWISRRVAREPRALPGLYFGRSGTAWALLEAGKALDDQELTDLATSLARRVPVRWPNPDVCHGVAGAGLTQLRFWEITGEDDFLARAREAADAMIAATEHRRGLVVWPIPQDFVSGLAGLVHYGFAHGVAGAGAFLLAAGRVTGESAYLELAASAADTLVSVAQMDRGAAYWPSGEDSNSPRTNWCSGSSGVGTFLLRMWQEHGDDPLGELAAQAAVAVRRSRWHAGTAQCHGLAGDGEFLLDLAEAFDEERYRDWARELAVSIHVRHAMRDGRMVAPDETRTTVVADYNTGLSGVLAFLLRLRDGGSRLWLPESFATTLRR
jgi:Lanthionine synthetase C-like protein/Protein kinase domain